MIKVNLIYWNEQNNFGDQLSPFIISSLINKDKYELIFNQKKNDINIVGIGSYIHSAKNKSFIFGSGIRTDPPIDKHNYIELNVCAVRGPLTKKFLEDRNIYVPDIFGDPALLLSKFYTPVVINDLNTKIGIIPHHSNYKYYKNIKLNDKFHLISPMDDWHYIINQLVSCKCIISSSLHGLICSDAYNIPNIWLDEIKISCGHFKFKDYFLSQGRPCININTLNDFNENDLYNGGNKIDLDKLINSFPFSL